MIKTELRLEIEKAIDKCLDDVCEKDYWINAYISKNTSKIMADAAIAVLDAIESTQEMLEKEYDFKG